MTITPQNVTPFYDGWRLTNDRLIEGVGALSPEGARAAGRTQPLADLGHRRICRDGPRLLRCIVCKEPGAERTPFTDPANEGWEDDLSHPRGTGELVSELEST
jgi:hypothetical protein